MTKQFAIIRETLTQARDLLTAAIASREIPKELLEKEKLTLSMVDAKISVQRALSSLKDSGHYSWDLLLAKNSVRDLLEMLQNANLSTVLDSTMARYVATALTLLYDLEKAQNQEDVPIPLVTPSSRRSQSPRPSRAILKVDMLEDSGHSFFSDLEGGMDSVGLFVASYDLKQAGQPVVLRVRLEPKTIINLHGTISWTREFNQASPEMIPGMGISLHNIGKAEHQAIKRFLSKRDILYFEAS